MDIKFIMPILRSVPLAVLFVFAICSFSFLHSFSRFLVYVQKKSRLSWMTSCPYRHLIGYGRIKFCCCSCYSCNWNIYISSRLLSAKDFVHYECIFLWNHNNDFICNDSRTMADGSISFFFILANIRTANLMEWKSRRCANSLYSARQWNAGCECDTVSTSTLEYAFDLNVLWPCS